MTFLIFNKNMIFPWDESEKRDDDDDGYSLLLLEP